MNKIKGQGAIQNIDQRFRKVQYEEYYDDLIWEEKTKAKVELIKIFPKSVINDTKGMPFGYSVNPYQGCEHGCSYCYARSSHEYWSYNAGLDFERKILYKENIVGLLKEAFGKKKYIPEPIALSGNTDCYQPIESKLKLTRQVLETCLEHNQPVQILTKNALILRDLDLLKEMSRKNLINVSLSINSLSEDLRLAMEPRTSTVRKRLKTLELLSENNIPSFVIMGPIIPALNSHEVLSIMEEVANAGALGAGMTIVRLNDTVAPVFKEWIESHYPDRASKVLNQIKELHQGELGNLKNKSSRVGTGSISSIIRQTYELGLKKYFSNIEKIPLDCSQFIPKVTNQMKLF